MQISQGRKTITLGDETVEMLCTPRAAMRLSDAFGGLLQAQQRCIGLDMTAIVAVINAGANRAGDAAKRTEAQVFAAGLQDVAGDAIEFITLLCNGGKPRGESAPADEGAEGNGQS
ncbi:hypothetical protein [Azospirillum canadense]|uniref:hypothetical protein n=1 Tax=Azospirillum canadense TaxID=403962 RepID=UPI002227D30D|nr:hypothetical protein [Azospirillum canadense]MCW2242805.1 hypothetical protein [Azospirillum canadense]